MMPSLRKKVAGFIRQLSVNNHAEVSSVVDVNSSLDASGCFIHRYLNGGDVGVDEPVIVHARSPQELPRKPLGHFLTGADSILAAVTGPDDGLRSVNKKQRHLSTSDPDVDYIDIFDSQHSDQQERITANASSDCIFSQSYGRWFTINHNSHPIDNSVMHIRAAGSVFSVGQAELLPLDYHQSQQRSQSSLYSNHQSDLLTLDYRQSHSQLSPLDYHQSDVIPPPLEYQTDNFNMLRKSKSAPAPFHKKKATSKIDNGEEIAGVKDWKKPHDNAFGAAITLYEIQPLTQENAGNPIADCFALVARQDSALLVLADGVNWGEKACIAARSAVHGCVEHLQKALFNTLAPRIINTSEVFIALLRSFHAAHNMILQEDGMLTTLTTAVVLPLSVPDKYVVCVCNVGDSLAYVYSEKHGVREITKGSHDIHCMRDMRDALGALGPVDGQNPELNNLTCSMTEIDKADIVFITSDGISDNFDPVVGKFAVLPPSNQPNINKTGLPSQGLPTVQAYQRHQLGLLRMDDLLKHGVSGEGPPCNNARTLCELLLDFATRLTSAKRRILEDTDLYYEPCGLKELSKAEQRLRRKKVLDKLQMVPGKLDHASVVAYKAGFGAESNLRETNL